VGNHHFLHLSPYLILILAKLMHQ